jgi:hypothetical protein
MPRHPPLQLANLLFATVIFAGAGASAAELGDAKVNSYLGQQLSADIELTSLHDAAAVVQVRVASLDVYRGAGLEMPSVMSSVNLSVVRRDGKQFLHITSTRPIEADHLHLYLELNDGGQRGVRLATLWFTPDPTPPAPIRLVAAPVPAPPVVQEIAPARKTRGAPLPPSHQHLVRPLSEPKPATQPAPKPEPEPKPATQPEPKPAPAPKPATQPVPKPAPEPKPATQSAAKPAPEPKPATQSVPKPAPEPKPATQHVPKPAPEPKPAPVLAHSDPKPAKATTPAEPKPAKVAEQPKPAALPDEPKPPPLAWSAAKARQAAPAAVVLPKPAPSCPKEPSPADSACTGLDSKNAELRAELVKLEARVKTLQDQEQVRAAAAAKAAAAPKPEPQAKPPKAPRDKAAERPAADEKFGQVIDAPAAPLLAFKPVKLKPVVPALPPPPKMEAAPQGMPWGWIAGAGAGVFALIGALRFWRHRRKQVKKVHKVHEPLPETDDDEQIEPTFG